MRFDYLEKVEHILLSWGLNYHKSEPGIISFDLSASKCKSISITINIEETPRCICSLYLKYPFRINKDYSYFVYQAINSINAKYSKGTYIFNDSCEEVYCAYTFYCENNFEDNFALLFVELLTAFDHEGDRFLELSNGIVSDAELKELSKMIFRLLNTSD